MMSLTIVETPLHLLPSVRSFLKSKYSATASLSFMTSMSAPRLRDLQCQDSGVGVEFLHRLNSGSSALGPHKTLSSKFKKLPTIFWFTGDT